MKKRNITPFALAMAMLVVLIVAFVVRGSISRSERITLPAQSDASAGANAPNDAAERLDRVEVTPETVQSVIAVLSRPQNYSRTITIERYWSGGSAVATAKTYVLGALSRCDVSEGSAAVRRVVSNGERAAVWYGSGTEVYRTASLFSADAEQGIPTYEDILALDPAQITAADYRLLEGRACIYVETEADAQGYFYRWYVGTDTGLLLAAEKLCDGEVVYRMASLSSELDVVTEADFALPDGAPLD